MEATKPLVLRPTNRARPAREAALDDAFASFAVVMRKIRIRVEGDAELDPKVVGQLVKVTDTYSKLVRTDILHDQHQDPSQHNDEDLLELIEDAKKALGAGDIEVE